MSFGTLGQIAVPVSDPDAAQAFYSNKVGLRMLFRFGAQIFFDCGGVRLLLEGNSKKPPEGGTGVCLYWKTQGIEETHARLKGRGVIFVDEPHLVARLPDHELWMTFFHDPDGNLLALMEEKRG